MENEITTRCSTQNSVGICNIALARFSPQFPKFGVVTASERSDFYSGTAQSRHDGLSQESSTACDEYLHCFLNRPGLGGNETVFG